MEGRGLEQNRGRGGEEEGKGKEVSFPQLFNPTFTTAHLSLFTYLFFPPSGGIAIRRFRLFLLRKNISVQMVISSLGSFKVFFTIFYNFWTSSLGQFLASIIFTT